MINSFLAETVKKSVARLTRWTQAARPARRPRRASIAVEQIEDRCVPATLNLLVQASVYVPEPEVPPPGSDDAEGEFHILPADDGVVIECPMFVDPLPGEELVVPPDPVSVTLGEGAVAVPTDEEGSESTFTFDVPDEVAALGWVRMDLYVSADGVLDDQDVLLSSEGTYTWQDENGDFHGEFYPYFGAEDVEGQNLIAVFTAETPKYGPIYCLDGTNPDEWVYMTGVGGEEATAQSGPKGRGGKHHRNNDDNGPKKTRRNERRNKSDNDRPGRRNNAQSEDVGRRGRNGGKHKVSGDAGGTRLADPSLGMIWWDGSEGDAPSDTWSDTDFDDTPGDDGEGLDTEVFDEIAE